MGVSWAWEGFEIVFLKERGWVVGWWAAGGAGWLEKGGRLESQRRTNNGGGGAWLTERRVPQGEMTPLHLAAKKGHTAVARALLAAGADKDAKGEVRRERWFEGMFVSG